jgi:hypothetical protein
MLLVAVGDDDEELPVLVVVYYSLFPPFGGS